MTKKEVKKQEKEDEDVSFATSSLLTCFEDVEKELDEAILSLDSRDPNFDRDNPTPSSEEENKVQRKENNRKQIEIDRREEVRKNYERRYNTAKTTFFDKIETKTYQPPSQPAWSKNTELEPVALSIALSTPPSLSKSSSSSSSAAAARSAIVLSRKAESIEAPSIKKFIGISRTSTGNST